MAGPGDDFRKERIVQLQARTALLADTRAEILRLLTIAANQVRYRLGLAGSAGEQANLAALQKEITRVMVEFGDSAAARLGSAAGQAFGLGADLVEQPLEAAGVALRGLLPILDDRQLTAMRSFMTGRIRDVGVQAANGINTQLGLVMIGSQPLSDAVTHVNTLLGGESRDRAVTIVRTEISRAYAVASQARAEQAAAVVPGMQKQWRRSGKVHSRFSHDMADGQVVDVDKPFIIHGKNGPVELMFPHDPKAPPGETINCGCTMIPFKADWEMSTPGRRRFTEKEMQANPLKADIQDALDNGKSVLDAMRGGKAA